MTEPTPELVPVETPVLSPLKIDQVPPYRLALIIDGVVHIIMNTDERTAAVLLSNPTVVITAKDSTPTDSAGWGVMIGWRYENGQFLPPLPEGSENQGEAV